MTTDRAALERELAELEAEIADADGWGAGVGARYERIREIEVELRRMCRSTALPADAPPFDAVEALIRSIHTWYGLSIAEHFTSQAFAPILQRVREEAAAAERKAILLMAEAKATEWETKRTSAEEPIDFADVASRILPAGLRRFATAIRARGGS